MTEPLSTSADSAPPQDVRHEYLSLARRTLHLRTEARGMQAVADRTRDFITPASDRFERTRAEIMRRNYQQMADDLTTLADEIAVYREDARAQLGAGA